MSIGKLWRTGMLKGGRMASDKDALFSSEYWNLHRNTLFFSAVTLVLSARGTDFSSFSIAGLALGKLGAKTLLTACILASIYSLFSFFLEWREDALQFIIKRNDLHGHMMSQRTEALATLVQCIDLVNAEQRANENTRLFLQDDAANVTRTVFEGELRLFAHQWCNARNAIDQPVEPTQMVDDFTLSNAGLFPDPPYPHSFPNRLGNMEENLRRIPTHQQEYLITLKGLSPKLWSARLADNIRVWGIGIGAPSFMFMIAATHAIGSLGIHWFSSWIF